MACLQRLRFDDRLSRVALSCVARCGLLACLLWKLLPRGLQRPERHVTNQSSHLLHRSLLTCPTGSMVDSSPGNLGGSSSSLAPRMSRSRRSSSNLPEAPAAAAATAETGIDDIKRVLDHESAELFRESLQPHTGPTKHLDFQLGEVLDELLATEANYLRDMRFTVSKFAKPLRELLDAAQVQAIFSNLATLLELHANLSSALPQPDGPPPQIALSPAAAISPGDPVGEARHQHKRRASQIAYARMNITEKASAWPEDASSAPALHSAPHTIPLLMCARAAPRRRATTSRLPSSRCSRTSSRMRPTRPTTRMSRALSSRRASTRHAWRHFWQARS